MMMMTMTKLMLMTIVTFDVAKAWVIVWVTIVGVIYLVVAAAAVKVIGI